MMDASKVLPNELWLQTLGYLSKTDLKTLRLSMEPHLSFFASSLLFTTAFIAARKGVLDTFTNLTTHPVYRAYVKEIVFDSSWIDLETVTSHKDEPASASLFYEQEDIQTNELQIRLENAFQCLSGVKTVSYADLSRISCLPGDYSNTMWDLDYSHGPLICRHKSHLGLDEIRDCCLMTGEAAKCPHDVNKSQYRRTFGGLILLLQVLSDYASTTLQQLNLGSRVHACEDRGIPYWFMLPKTDIYTFHCFPKIFCNLRKFELSISIFGHVEISSSVTSSTKLNDCNIKGEGLASLLGLAKNLEEIKLTGDPKAEKLCVSNALGDHKWPGLRTLHLGGFEASASGLEDFLKRHALSLQRLTLCDFNLTSGSWLDLGASVTSLTPALELMLSLVSVKNRFFDIEKYLPLPSGYLDLSGPIRNRYDKATEDEDDGDESDDSSSSEELDYSSDDSSPESDEPRRKPDLDLLQTIDADLRTKVEKLRSELQGCPVQECLKALALFNGVSRKARAGLMEDFGYTELDTMAPETRAIVERLMDEVPFDCSELECLDAVRSSNGTYARARGYLQEAYGHRQKIFKYHR